MPAEEMWQRQIILLFYGIALFPDAIEQPENVMNSTAINQLVNHPFKGKSIYTNIKAHFGKSKHNKSESLRTIGKA